MAILSQMPVWFVFAVVFIFIVAIVASFALGFVVKQKPIKFTLWGAGAVLTVLAVACFLVGGESGDEEKEVAAIEAEQKTKKPADDGSKVKIVIDEGTLHDSGGYDPLKGEALELEKMESAPKESAADRRWRESEEKEEAERLKREEKERERLQNASDAKAYLLENGEYARYEKAVKVRVSKALRTHPN
ncbi:MAG: hypothetical protein ACI4OA_07525, partial [Selenomonadaceae bacterium]